MAEDGNISRSGRVRKKSSKLTDFHSPDELELKPVKRLSNSNGSVVFHSSYSQNKTNVIDDLPPAQLLASEEEQTNSGSYLSSDIDLKLEDGLDMDLDMKEEDFDDIPDINVEDDDEDDSDSRGFANSSPKTEIIKKPLDLPQHSEVKKRRKDRGKSRITAYMLWAKQIRASLLTLEPDMDFAKISKKLGELWASVPNTEKYNWKRRAKRLASKGLPPRNLLTSSKSSIIITKPRIAPMPVLQTVTRAKANNDAISRNPGTQPIDVAAHLTLLGESLSIIGERLTEHEGQIAVSGSLSVLLDSLLCAMGPLLCLTQNVPQLNGANPTTLNKILDNVAYIMPGL